MNFRSGSYGVDSEYSPIHHKPILFVLYFALFSVPQIGPATAESRLFGHEDRRTHGLSILWSIGSKEVAV